MTLAVYDTQLVWLKYVEKKKILINLGLGLI